MTITDKNNIKILVDSYFTYRTYGGLIAGLPNRDINKTIIKEMPKNVSRALGNTKIHLIEPKIEVKAPSRVYMPRTINAVLLMSKPFNSSYYGSALILVWFTKTIPNDLHKEISEQVSNFNWINLAEEYSI